MYRHKVIKNAKLIKAWIKLKLIIVLALTFFKLFFFMSLKQCMTLSWKLLSNFCKMFCQKSPICITYEKSK